MQSYSSTIIAREIVRDYSISKPLGFGARSVILGARRDGNKTPYAIKFVAVERREDLNVVRHLENEYAVLSALQRSKPRSQHIVRPVTYRRKKGFFKTQAAYLVMEYVSGLSLSQKHDYSMGELLRILPQVSEALLYIHEKGYVHGDLKPDNIMVDASLKTKLIDFGFAAPIGSPIRGVKGTVGYLAPEQVGGELAPETDVFNFGAAMYWLTTGYQLPSVAAPGDRSRRLPERGLPLKAPFLINSSVPAELSELIVRCCADSPADRPAMRVVHNRLSEMAVPYEIGVKQ